MNEVPASLKQKLTLIDSPKEGCFLVCHTINTASNARRVTSIVLDKGGRKYKRILRTTDLPLWNQLRSMLT